MKPFRQPSRHSSFSFIPARALWVALAAGMVLCGCGNDPSLEEQVKASMQKTLHKVPRLANSNLTVEKVTAKQVSGYDYDAVAKIWYKGQVHDAPLKIHIGEHAETFEWKLNKEGHDFLKRQPGER